MQQRGTSFDSWHSSADDARCAIQRAKSDRNTSTSQLGAPDFAAEFAYPLTAPH